MPNRIHHLIFAVIGLLLVVFTILTIVCAIVTGSILFGLTNWSALAAALLLLSAFMLATPNTFSYQSQLSPHVCYLLAAMALALTAGFYYTDPALYVMIKVPLAAAIMFIAGYHAIGASATSPSKAKSAA